MKMEALQSMLLKLKKTPVDENVNLAIKIGDELVKIADEATLNRDNDTIILYMGGKEIGRIAVQ